jgi:L-amino acid N-acyltransferase YncA
MQIRPAVDDDWPLIHPFYRAIVDAGRTYALPAGQSLEEARPNWMAVAPARTFVAVDDDGTVLGSAKAGPNRPGRGAHVATGSFLVDPARAGHGVGRALGEHVLAWARDEGYRAMQFNAVVETNRPAVHLWRSLGFRIVGTVPEAFDDAEEGLVGLHVMHLSLR